MDVRIIQKGMPIPKEGFVVNAEPIREDYFNNDGIFNQTNIEGRLCQLSKLPRRTERGLHVPFRICPRDHELQWHRTTWRDGRIRHGTE